MDFEPIKNKIEIRSKIIKLLSEYKNFDFNNENFIKTEVELLKKFEQKSYIEILFKEAVGNEDETKLKIIAFLMFKVLPAKFVEQEAIKYMLSGISDEQKYNIIKLLRYSEDMSGYIDYLNCFDNPEVLVDNDTQRLLNSALVNPETQIDFLDFLSSLGFEDKKVLINSLYNDYDGDDLANILYPVLYLDTEDEIKLNIVEKLGELRSFYAYEALNWLLNFTQNKNLKSGIKKSLAKLRLQGIKEESITKVFDKIYEKMPIYKCYISEIDGTGYFGGIISRKREDETLRILCVAINDEYGITEAFGFNLITISEFERIIEKFSEDSNLIEISQNTLKMIFENAQNLNLKTREYIPYEYLCFKNILHGIKPTEKDFLEFINKNFEKSNKNEIKTEDFNKIFEENILKKFFFKSENNELFNEKIQDFVKALQINAPDIQIFNDFVEKNYKKMIEIDTLKIRILILAYSHGFESKIGKILYEMTKNEAEIDKIMRFMIKKGLYNYFVELKEKKLSQKDIKNIFRKKQKDDSGLSLERIYKIINIIEENWVE